MEPNTQPETHEGPAESTQPVQSVESAGSAGPVIAIVIILVVIILGGLYFWSERKNDMRTNPYGSTSETLPADEVAPTDDTTSAIQKQSSSDSLDSIEADLQNTNTVDVDSELYSS